MHILDSQLTLEMVVHGLDLPSRNFVIRQKRVLKVAILQQTRHSRPAAAADGEPSREPDGRHQAGGRRRQGQAALRCQRTGR